MGIGINVSEPEGGFPKEIKDIAGAIYEYKKAPENFREQLIAEIWNRFISLYRDLSDSEIPNRYRALSMMPGRAITVLSDYMSGQGREATALTVDDDFGLIVRYADGTTETLTAGDVSLRFKD